MTDPVTPRPGDRLVRTGGVVFLVGLGSAAVTFLPFLLGATDRPLWASLGSFLMPVGFAVAAVGLIRGIRAERRAAAGLHAEWT